MVKRHPALRDLSDDHHHGLVHARRLVKAAECAQGSGGGAASDVQVAQEFLQFFEEHTRAHFREEEEVLLPAFANYGDPAQEPIVQMLVQHVHINRLVRQLASEVCDGKPLGETMHSVGTLLQGHIRLEENVVFPIIEQAMPEDALDALGRELH
jgi:hemerythrin-like domain-containing protein